MALRAEPSLSSQMSQPGNFEHYQLLTNEDGSYAELGRGAMGVTYKAFDTNLRCNVALKVINATFLNDSTAGERFLREARGAARLRHRNVASVFHLGQTADSYFYSMEFIEGETLDALVKREGAVDLVVALDIAAQVSNALMAAAKQSLVHRDIKPANLMLVREDDGEMIVKVIDFGLVKSAMMGSAAGALTSTGFVGTPYFASPEQLDQQDEDIRSDIYSLGVTLWFMLTGRPTFMGSVASVIAQHMEKLPSFESLTVLPTYVVDVLRKMLEKDLTKRYQNPGEVRADLKRCIEILRNSQSSPGMPMPASIDDGFQTIAMSSTHGLKAAASTNAMLAGRYRLIEDLNPANPNRTYHGEDVTLKRRVRLKIVTGDTMSFALIQRDVESARSAMMPNFIEVLDVARSGSAGFVVLEWLEGFSLVELLRVRHELTPRETLTLLEQVAPAVDRAREIGVLLELQLREVFIHFPEGPGQADPNVILRCPIAEWPTFVVKINPLGRIQELEMAANPQHADRTMMAAPQREPGEDIVQVGRLAYELLGGKAGRFAPLANLTEGGNAVIRRCVMKEGDFATAADFVMAMSRGKGGETPRSPGVTSMRSPAASYAAPAAAQSMHPAARSAAPAGRSTSGPPYSPAQSFAPKPPKPASSMMPLVAGVAGLLALGAIGAVWMLMGGGKTATADVSTGGTPALKPNSDVKVVASGRKPPQQGMPWKNSLGLDFVPLGEVHFAATKTRVRDFKAFVDSEGYEAIGGMTTHQWGSITDLGNNSWEKPGFPQTPDQPVVGISYNDAVNFCKWLTAKEQKENSLKADQAYRLPTDKEWSDAVGLPVESGATPLERSGKIKDVYPWGATWPPPANVRNYAGSESKPGSPKDWRTIPNFTDAYPRTAPVAKFGPAQNGVYDLGGNAWEWLRDEYGNFRWHALRGGSWATSKQEEMLSSYRLGLDPSFRQDDVGFRCVIESGAGAH